MFCRNCGKQLIGTPEICINCGAKPLAAASFCPACGTPTTTAAVYCVKCGAGLQITAASSTTGKSKTAAVLLAVFLGWWTWLYTYKKDAWKFWAALVVSSGSILTFWIIGSFWFANISKNINTNSPPAPWLPFVFIVINFAIQISAIVVTAIRPLEWYENFGRPNNFDNPLSKA